MEQGRQRPAADGQHRQGDDRAGGTAGRPPEARRGGRALIGVVLHASSANGDASFFTAARRLLTWGFRRI
jgi:hypothetical protein